MVEVIVAITLLGLILAGLGVLAAGFARFNGSQWGRQQCLAAAQAQLDSLTARDQPLNPEDIARLWPDVTLTSSRTPGQGRWKGLELVEVVAAMDAHPRQINVRLAQYMRIRSQHGEGEQPQ